MIFTKSVLIYILRLLDGRVEYYNLQNGDGTLDGGDGGYEFVDLREREEK